jgi:PAS domain S-box-containing protein
VFAPQGGIFVGGAPADLVYIDPAGHATTLAVDPGAATDRTILALALGPEGDLWVATRLGLYRLAGARPGPLERVEVPGVSTDARFSSLLVADGRLWSATPNGIVVLDHGHWNLFDVRAGFRASAMRYLVRSHGHRMCVAYAEAIGVTCFETDGRTVSNLEHISTADGLATGMVYFLGEDRQQRLWIGTGDGVDVVTPQGIDHFSAADGLAGDDAAATAFFADSDGSLWLGATGGASHVHAERYTGPLQPPRVVVRDGRLGDQVLREGLETTHDQNALALEFSADSLADPERIEYQVRLLPLEHKWSASHLRESRYPALLGGDYTLEVRARIGAGAWGPTATLGFHVRPAWWQTGWFLVAVGALVLLALAGIFALRQRVVLSRQTRRLNEESAATVRLLLELVPDLITVYRGEDLIYMNHAARRLFCSSAPYDAGAFAARVHPDDCARREAMLQRARVAAAGETPEMLEVRIRDGEGTWRICEVSCARIELAGTPAIVVSGRDVTERNRLRSQVLVSDRMASLGTLAAGIAHEINNPLTYVMGNLELIAETVAAGKPDELASAIRDATDGAQRVRTIVQGLRSFSRSEEERRVPLDLSEVLEATLRLTANEVRHRAQLAVELGVTPKVVADAGRLTQVFINLVVNAAHAIPEGKSAANLITVRTRTDTEGRAVVEIVDTGLGMSAEVMARAFDPFFTTKGVGSGTGLGLAICHGIVSALGGDITIESAIDRGTVVRVVLPSAPVTAPVVVVAPPVVPAAAETRRVMVVDDDVLVGETIARLLRRDHEVVVASCGEEALAHIQAGEWFDAIVSDVMMPNMTGLELLEHLVTLAPEQSRRLLFLSGGVFADETQARLEELGTVQLDKPINGRDLRAAVASVVAAPRSSARQDARVAAAISATCLAAGVTLRNPLIASA